MLWLFEVNLCYLPKWNQSKRYTVHTHTHHNGTKIGHTSERNFYTKAKVEFFSGFLSIFLCNCNVHWNSYFRSMERWWGVAYFIIYYSRRLVSGREAIPLLKKFTSFFRNCGTNSKYFTKNEWKKLAWQVAVVPLRKRVKLNRQQLRPVDFSLVFFFCCLNTRIKKQIVSVTAQRI